MSIRFALSLHPHSGDLLELRGVVFAEFLDEPPHPAYWSTCGPFLCHTHVASQIRFQCTSSGSSGGAGSSGTCIVTQLNVSERKDITHVHRVPASFSALVDRDINCLQIFVGKFPRYSEVCFRVLSLFYKGGSILKLF